MTPREQWKVIHRVKRIFARIDREKESARIRYEADRYPIKFELQMRMPMHEGPIMPYTYAAS
jgi:hypothetical protein